MPILPDTIPEDLTNEDELLKLIHRVIFDVRICQTWWSSLGLCIGVSTLTCYCCFQCARARTHTHKQTNIVEGELVCNNCARSYPITHAVPNMLLEDDEM